MHHVFHATNRVHPAGPVTPPTTEPRVEDEGSASEVRDAPSGAEAHAEVLCNPLDWIRRVMDRGTGDAGRTATTRVPYLPDEHRSDDDSADDATSSESSGPALSSSDPPEPVVSVADRMPLAAHAALNFLREGACQAGGRLPALMACLWLAKELTEELSPWAAFAVFGVLDIAITVGNHYYLAHLQDPGNAIVREAAGIRPSSDSLTFKCVRVMAMAAPLVAIPVLLGGAAYASGHEMSDEMMWNLTSAGPECALKYGVTGGPWAFGAHLAVNRVLQPLVVGKVARVLRQLLQSLSRSPVTSGCRVGYEFPDGSFQRLTDHDQEKLNALRDSPYLVSTFVLLFCCATWMTRLSDSIDDALCSTMIELGLDLNSPVWGAINEGFDGAFPVLAGLLFGAFPERFGVDPETASRIRCRVDRQPSILDGWQRCVDDFKRHASIRLTTGTAGADLPSVLAGLLDLTGLRWPGRVVRGAGSAWSGGVCAARARYLAYWEDRSTSRPGGLFPLVGKGLRHSMSGLPVLNLSGDDPGDKPMTPREATIHRKLEAWKPPALPAVPQPGAGDAIAGDDPV